MITTQGTLRLTSSSLSVDTNITEKTNRNLTSDQYQGFIAQASIGKQYFFLHVANHLLTALQTLYTFFQSIQ